MIRLKTKERLRQQVSKNEIEPVLEELLAQLAKTKFRDEVIHLANRYRELKKNISQGLLSYDQSQAERNKLVHAILKFIDDPDAYGKVYANNKQGLIVTEALALVKDLTKFAIGLLILTYFTDFLTLNVNPEPDVSLASVGYSAESLNFPIDLQVLKMLYFLVAIGLIIILIKRKSIVRNLFLKK